VVVVIVCVAVVDGVVVNVAVVVAVAVVAGVDVGVAGVGHVACCCHCGC